MLSDGILLLGAAIAFLIVILLPLLAPFWRQILLGFLIYLAFEGLVRRVFSSYQQWIYVGKDVVLLPVYIGCYLEFVRRRRKYHLDLGLNISWIFFVLFIAVILVQILNPNNRGFLLAIISLKVYLWYLPLILVAYVWARMDEQILEKLKGVYWIVVPVFLMAIFQAITGWGTAYYSQESIVATGGTFTRAVQVGTLVNISSTLFGGRLATFSAVWTLIFYTLILYYIDNRGKKRLFTILFLVSFISLVFGFNNTALVSTLIGLVILSLFALSIHQFDISQKSLQMTVGIMAALFFVFIIIQLFFSGQDTIISTDLIKSFFGRILLANQREVVTKNVWQGIQATYRAVGFWGWGTGSLTQGTDYVDPALAGGYSFMAQTRAESILLRTLIELGVIGTLVFVLSYLSLFWYLLQRAFLLRMYNPSVAIVVMGGCCVLLLYLMMAYKHHGFAGDPTLQAYVYVWVGIGLGMSASVRDSSLQSSMRFSEQRYKRDIGLKKGIIR